MELSNAHVKVRAPTSNRKRQNEVAEYGCPEDTGETPMIPLALWRACPRRRPLTPSNCKD